MCVPFIDASINGKKFEMISVIIVALGQDLQPFVFFVEYNLNENFFSQL